MSYSSQMGIAANVLASTTALLEASQQQNGDDSPILHIPEPSTCKPIWYEVNGSLIDLREITVIRKALNGNLNFVYYLRSGVKCSTHPFKYRYELDEAYLEIMDKLQNI